MSKPIEVLFSVKMRASKTVDGRSYHLSGCERIVPQRELDACLRGMRERAMSHPKGAPDFVNFKLEALAPEDVTRLPALPIREIVTSSVSEGRDALKRLLLDEGVAQEKTDRILELFAELGNMRGAVLLDVDSMSRLEPDQTRGVRATRMDADRACAIGVKNHFREAIVLASKVASAPGIVGELCVSDDPDYQTGYFASRKSGYVRITTLKERGSESGGRIFLFRGTQAEAQGAIDYLERQAVIVTNVPDAPPRSKTPRSSHLRETTKTRELELELDAIRKRGLLRTEKLVDSAPGAKMVVDGKPRLILSSNGYLGLANDPRVITAAISSVRQFGVGTAGSRSTLGTTTAHRELERRLAEFLGTESALVFNSGYVANLGLIASLCGPEDAVFSDSLNHASIIDGRRQTKATTIVYETGNPDDLERKIRQTKFRRGLIVSDGVFSMTGEVAPAPELTEIADRYGLFLALDEAHALGTIGRTGRGTIEYFADRGKSARPFALTGSLSKSLGAEGGYVAGPQVLVDLLRNRARGFIFSTALPASSAAAAKQALDIIDCEPELVRKLQENTKIFCRRVIEQGVALGESPSPIVPIPVGDETRAVEIAETLERQGLYVSAIRYPSVAFGHAILRVSICASHTREELEDAADRIAFELRQ